MSAQSYPAVSLDSQWSLHSVDAASISRSLHCLAIGFIGAALFASTSPAQAESEICQDITRSITLSRSGFESLHNGSETAGSRFIVTETLFEAPECEVLPNATAHSLRCSWSFAYDDALAEEHYDYLLSVVPACLGSHVAVSKDQPVNHPDTYKSHIYQLPAAELRVTLKNKYAMKKKFVSMIVEGRHP